MASPDTKTPSLEADNHEAANVDKIRDIIFGSQMRDYEKRFNRLEERLTADAQSLREDTKKRFDTLEAFLHKEIDALNQRVKAEKSERIDALKDLSRELRETSKAIEKRLAQIEDQLSKETAALRAQILEQSKQLSGEIASKHRALANDLDRETQNLRNEKVDREAMADLLSEFALRLKGDLKLPGGK